MALLAVIGEKTRMLSRGDEGRGQGQVAGRPSQQDYSHAPSYDVPTFNPDDEIPF